MRQSSCYTKIISLLKQLHVEHSSYNIGRHISTALDGYGDLWNVTDKEFLYALEKYQVEQDLDVVHIAEDSEINKIIEEGTHLDSILLNDEDEDE